MGLMGREVFYAGVRAQFSEAACDKRGFGMMDQLGADALSAKLRSDPNPFEERNGSEEASIGVATNFDLAEASGLAGGGFRDEAEGVVTRKKLCDCLLMGRGAILGPER